MQELKTKYRPLLEGEKIEALFMFQAGTVWASLDTVYKNCISDDRFNVRLVLITEMTVEKSHMAGARAFLDEKGLSYELYEQVDFSTYNPHVVFIQFPYDVAFHTPKTLSIQFKKRGTRVIYVPYGIEISDTQIARKDHFSSFVVENCWRLYTSSYGLEEEYNKYCRNRRAVRVTGSPKFDAISNKDSLPMNEEINRRANGRPIIVWKMHYPKKNKEGGQIKQITPYMSEYLEFLKYVKKCSDLFFVILAHPKMLRGVVASDTQGDENLMKQVHELIEKCQKMENVFIDGTDDYRNTFYHADAIILDRSAVMIEAAMLDVPVLLMKNSDYSEPMTVPVGEVCDSFVQGSKCCHMISFIEDFKNGTDRNKEARKAAVEKNFPFNDGMCGYRIKEDIVNSINESDDVVRIAIYGTGEICKYYMVNQNWAESKLFKIVGVIDSNPDKWGSDYYGYDIIPPEDISKLNMDALVITTEPHYFEIKKSLVYDYYIDERCIWRLDEFILAFESLRGE